MLKCLVSHKDGKDLVLGEDIQFTYKKYDNLIIGVDSTNTFVKTYKYTNYKKKNNYC